MNKKTLPLRTLAITLLLVTFSVATSMAQAVGDKFKVDKLYYKITNLTPAEVQLVPQNTEDPYWNDGEAPTGTLTIPAKVTHKGKQYAVTSIEKYAFYDCSSLSSVTIPNSVTSIGGSAFAWCTSLTTVTIGNSVTSIGRLAFWGCSSLTAINVATGNTAYSSDKGVLFNKAKTTLIKYPEGKKETEYTIPNSVTSIGETAFESCSSLTAVTIPSSVTSIGWSAFRSCSSLTSVTIGNSVTSIGEQAFISCISLTTVTIGNSVTSIGAWAFSRCSSLTAIISKIEDPSKVDMGNDVFKYVDKNTCIVYVPSGKVSAYQGAKQWKDFKNIKEATTGVNQHDGVAHTVTIYPTLVENGFTVETTGKVLEIYNLSGQRVQTVPLTSNKQFVNVSNLRQGVYLAKVKDWAVRFVKQ